MTRYRLEQLTPALRDTIDATAPARIYSDEHNAYWRPNANGYTQDVAKAWELPFISAFGKVLHCGPEKRIMIELVPQICAIPPEGWYCTRAPGHEGPCAAHATLTIDTESAPGAWETHIAHTPHLAAQVREGATIPPLDLPPLAPTDRWWAQRWIEKATPGELAAMRELLGA